MQQETEQKVGMQWRTREQMEVNYKVNFKIVKEKRICEVREAERRQRMRRKKKVVRAAKKKDRLQWIGRK